ncbi:response regulator [Sulfitobacter sp. S190]|uniref:response regulator n=1 Tax=Sulfitobacter sp. S190 TaxID=2867022 RepID=UPI0021A63CCB|nr:response regulator [Sulfitobacter sp. S190]UWR22881.1 response regulator [Sulfitobacter sp. S190]
MPDGSDVYGDETTVLIVESVPELAVLWRNHLARKGMTVTIARGQHDATSFISENPVDIIILDLVLDEGSALAISDFANYRRPDTRVIFVTNTTFFSDGSIFAHSANARAFVQSNTPPEDLAAMVAHYGSESRAS